MISPATATFVMPHYADAARAEDYLVQTLKSLHQQTDPDWQLVIVDDASPGARDRKRIKILQDLHPDRIFVIQQTVNRGQGFCRNVGVQWAKERGSRFVLFQDADDIAHPRRLEVTRRAFKQRPDVDFVYSTFSVIDEHGSGVPTTRLTPSLLEIIESHRVDPVEGPRAWIRMGVDTGYTTLTSTVAVRTELAVNHPFPHVRASEDAHAWFRMAAGGTSVAYLPSIGCLYRVPQEIAGSSDRNRIGADYYQRKAEVDTDGFFEAISISLQRQTIQLHEVRGLKNAFLRRLALTMEREGQHNVAREILGAVGQVGVR
ncbi:glycosyltransferase family 2 protein (plasmid) [Streptomyces sp. BB1-1-1]|uniref:glycosyltransferase family 2 protein n=1 Tax=Streptomyces sp. BB1-1-1 TaxID=3074430 RepID=UPI002877CD03|nr:glycosyltransferase family 2 protein [Streptomyces sp. BB1-1-1]WND32857.1 glycosyltransferase family 2 protein [Streptomyces sp. BB1-1-1]WND40074.1 glycosyltransferase family 2 protein [Streptomyces sp. BB1-1-1]WND40909.1 glycosyltransferase family 2 protein [Streptomyces sp. BB1-1-1]